MDAFVVVERPPPGLVVPDFTGNPCPAAVGFGIVGRVVILESAQPGSDPAIPTGRPRPERLILEQFHKSVVFGGGGDGRQMPTHCLGRQLRLVPSDTQGFGDDLVAVFARRIIVGHRCRDDIVIRRRPCGVVVQVLVCGGEGPVARALSDYGSRRGLAVTPVDHHRVRIRRACIGEAATECHPAVLVDNGRIHAQAGHHRSHVVDGRRGRVAVGCTVAIGDGQCDGVGAIVGIGVRCDARSRDVSAGVPLNDVSHRKPPSFEALTIQIIPFRCRFENANGCVRTIEMNSVLVDLYPSPAEVTGSSSEPVLSGIVPPTLIRHPPPILACVTISNAIG